MGQSVEFNKGITVIRDYPGGSNATTSLCMDNETTFYRKYADGSDAEKLYQQIRWIEENKEILPLPQILKTDKGRDYCFYDMAYVSHSVGLFEYAHSMPLVNSQDILKKLLDLLSNTIYAKEKCEANGEIISRYFTEKVAKNLERIRESTVIKDLMGYDVLFINGEKYNNIKEYEDIISEEFLQEIFYDEKMSVIHGDLTVENIICTRDERGDESFYIIDPNTGNILNSPNLDYAKLLQSLHGEYEFVRTAKDITVHENKIDYSYTHSRIYAELYDWYRKYLLNNFSNKTVRSIYIHEIIHWLRLLPYKLMKEPERAPAYYSKLIIIINEIAKYL